MELVDGPDLRARIAAGPLASLDVATMGADLAEALHYVHERGIIHRDVKPANVLLAPSGFPGRAMHAKLADFGIARLLDETRLTATGSLLGTASYLSPEQALGGTIGAPTDVYSLGLVLLECLTGTRAYPGTAVESAMARLQRQPRIPGDLGHDWTAVLAAMTARETADRPSAAEAAQSLRALVTGSDGTTSEPTLLLPVPTANAAPTEILRADAAPASSAAATTPAARPAKPRPTARGRVLLLLASALTMVALAVAALVFFNPSPEPDVVPPSYPAVDGTLGTHLLELQESVNP
jgi:serine/threonine protein kinase